MVLDPSVACKWFFADERAREADRVLERIEAGETVVVPALFRWEFTNLLVSAERAGRIDSAGSDIALETLRDLPIFVDHPGERLVSGSEISLARAYGITSYDAAYIAAAINANAELVTADHELARAGRDLGLDVTLV